MMADAPSTDPGDGVMSLKLLSQANPENAKSNRIPTFALEAEERLGKTSYRALRDVSCIAVDGVLYLHGCLPSQYLKQVAQEVASSARGVGHVINRIVVSTPARRARPGQATFSDQSI
jgi:osmotically-inducible protein OsmY